MRNVSTFHFILGVLIKYLINITQGVQFVRLENKIFVIDISEPKQSHKVNEISQTVNHDQNQSHKVNEISQMIINDPINTHISDENHYYKTVTIFKFCKTSTLSYKYAADYLLQKEVSDEEK